MKSYNAKIDSGEGGDTTIKAKNINEAMVKAIEWAEDGDWPADGCTINVRVEDDDDDENYLDEDIEIESEDAKKDRELADDGEIIAENKHEYSTEKIITMDGEAYYVKKNGGTRGSYDRMGGDGIWRDHPVDPTRQIDRGEARCLMLDWGYDPAEVAAITRCINE